MKPDKISYWSDGVELCDAVILHNQLLWICTKYFYSSQISLMCQDKVPIIEWLIDKRGF